MKSESAPPIRARMRAQRAALPAAERIEAARGLAARLEALPEFLTDQRVAGYWAGDGELPLAMVLPPLMARGQQFHLPVVTGPRATPLRFAPWRPGAAIVQNRFGIPEPEVAPELMLPGDRLELVLLPLVAFDRRGWRLGMGGGYYDATFAFLREGERPREPLLVGIGYAFQEVERLDAGAHDVRLDFICTERELIECAPPGP